MLIGQLTASFFCIRADGLTGADQVTVTIGIIDAGDAWPEFVLPDIGQGEGGLASRIGMFPFVCADHLLGMWGVLQRIIGLVSLTFFNGPDLFVDADRCV